MNSTDQSPSRLDFYLLLIAAFLAPLIGGHVSIDPRAIDLGLVRELFGGGSLPYLARLILGVLILGALALMAMRNRVIQLPNVKIILALTLLVSVLGFAILLSDFKYAATGEWLTWFIYGGTLFLAVGTLGRERGPIAAAGSLCAGISVAALIGFREYIGIMAVEPTHRIFAGWNNPNAAASIFVVGSLLALGLVAKLDSWKKIFPIVAAGFSLAALILTQSKGGYLAFGFGLISFIVIQVAAKVPLKKIAPSLIGVVAGVVIAFSLAQAAASASKSQALSRITGSGAMAEQSVGFRQNLWKSAIKIATKHPGGTGPGTFRFYSAEPGLTEPTVFAHQSYLQLAVEGGWAALLLFLALAGFWLSYAFRGIKKQPTDHAIFRAGAIAAILGLAAHCMIDSDLSFIGAGVALFLLVGITLQLSTDGTSPEAVPKNIRQTTVLITCVLPIFGIAIYASGEAQKATLMTALSRADRDQVRSAGEQLKSNPFGDPEATYLASMYAATSLEERLEGLQKIVNAMPQGRVIRATARTLAEADKMDEAIAVNERVFKYDPNNLRAHWLKVELLQKKNDIPAAIDAAKALVEVENQASFKTRAIPELIPTDTLEARLFLADHEADQAQKIKLLEEALLGFQKYFEITAPLVKRMTQEGVPEYGGENREEVLAKLEKAKAALTELKQIYGESGSTGSLSGETVTAISNALEFSF
jgi:O-antigen ligase